MILAVPGRALSRQELKREICTPRMCVVLESLWVTFPAACGVSPVDEPEFWTDGSLASTVGRHANEVMVSDYVKKQGQDYQKLHENRQLALF